jgi:GNAT superfamily N-acetyltransferase
VPTVEVKRTYLEMARPEDLRPAGSGDPRARIERAIDPPPSFYRYLYREVGRPWHWVDRLGWTDEDARSHLARPGVRLWVMYLEGSPAGYFELQSHDDGSVEIAYLGLLPERVGRGLGKLLMTAAVEEAWRAGANRVWVHTCTLDHPSALAAYVARGFRPFKEEIYTATLPAPAPAPAPSGG